MSLIPAGYPGKGTDLDQALSYNTLVLSYSNFTATGTRLNLIQGMASATPRQFAIIGNGTVDMPYSVAETIVRAPNGVSTSSPLESERAKLATGLVTYFTNIPNPGVNAYSIAFAVGGLNCTDIIDATWVSNNTISGTYSIPYVFKNISASTQIGGPNTLQPGNQPVINLNSSNQILQQDGTTPIVYGTNTLVVCPAYGVIFGAIQQPSIDHSPGTIGSNCDLMIRYRS